MTQPSVFHLAERVVWEDARATGRDYLPAEYAADGFVHCSTAAQVLGTANRYYAGRDDLVLLQIDAAALTDTLRWEPGTGDRDELFPHVYGPLRTGAVVGVHEVTPGPDGTFRDLP